MVKPIKIQVYSRPIISYYTGIGKKNNLFLVSITVVMCREKEIREIKDFCNNKKIA